MSLQSFSRRLEDHSSEAGFQFTFFCDFSNDGYRTKFIPSKSGKKASIAKLVAKGTVAVASVAERIHGISSITAGKTADGKEESLEKTASSTSAFADEFAKRFDAMSAEWHVEHDQAFEVAQEEAKKHFNRCAVCKRYACEYCFDDKEGVCREHSSTMSKGIRVDSGSSGGTSTTAVATAATMATKVASGEDKSEQPSTSPPAGKITCPQCQATVPLARFCGECGAKFGFVCPTCGNHVDIGVKFCGECGTKII